MSQINTKHANTEYSKRIKLTKNMLEKGKTAFEIANYFNLTVETIRKYIDIIRIEKYEANLLNYEEKKKNQNPNELEELSNLRKTKNRNKKLIHQKIDISKHNSLSSGPQKELKKGDELFKSEKTKGATCNICKNYTLYSNLLKWNKKAYVCKKCTLNLDKSKLDKLNQI